MRTNISERTVETQGLIQTSDFKIKANGKAFKVLIDGLYSDKIRAVIREIWSNAFDAHIAAGNADKPFDCQLPNQFDPIFRVRDYGTGMDHDTVMHLYTTVFESSKEDTNEQVGKLGLGSKSPFAYTDTFTVTAFDGNERRVYSAFIGKSYVPQIALMATVPSKEPRGIEIQFPVNSSDVSAFIEAARITSRGFDPLPNVSGTAFNVKPLETVMSGKGWRIVKDQTYGLRAHAKQGCVVYPLDPNALDHITAFERAILSSPFFIDFPIGDLEIAANREALGYDEATKKNIRARISEIADEIVGLYQKEVDACPTMWQACMKFRALLRSNLASGVTEVLRARITYRGKPLKPKQDLSTFLRASTEKTFDQGGLRAMKLDTYTLGRSIQTYGRRASLKFEPTVYTQVEAGETIVIFDDALSPASNPQGRIRHWYAKLPADQRGEVLWVKAAKNSLVFKRLLVELGRPTDVLNLADLEKPPVIKGVNDRRPTKVKKFEKNMWVETEIDEEDEIVFVELEKRDTLGHSDQPISYNTVAVTIASLIALKALPEDTVVYGIPQTHKAKIARNDHWTSLWTFAKQAVTDHYDAHKASLTYSYRAKLGDAQPLSKFFRDLASWDKFLGFEDMQSPASKLLIQWENVITKSETLKDMHHALTLHRVMGGDEPNVITINFDTFNKAVGALYPLVPVLLDGNRYINPETRKLIIDYINTVDAAAKLRQSASVSVSDAA